MYIVNNSRGCGAEHHVHPHDHPISNFNGEFDDLRSTLPQMNTDMPEDVLKRVPNDIPRPVTDSTSRQTRPHRFTPLFRYTLILVLLLLAKAVVPGWRYHVSEPGHQDDNHISHGLTTAEREKVFLSIPNPESALAASRAYATHPHLAGSIEDFEDAKVLLQLFQTEFGISAPSSIPIFPAGSSESRNSTLLLTTSDAPSKPTAWIDIYYPVMNTPLDRSLQILGSQGETIWTADLVEDGDPRDEEAHKYKDAVPTWHGFSCDGDVTGQLVYANYGLKEDYEELVSQGVNFTGKIVITRYGGIFRGLKVKGAEDLGAAGVLIYSDPRDDGFVTVKNGYAPYPAGPARNPTAVQRGSVQYLSFYPGDPTTPGYPAYENSDRTEGGNIPKIPSLPISWANAERLLEEIGDIYLGSDSYGRKRVSGKVSDTHVRLVNHVDTKITPIWNTMASIPGHIKNEVVVIGCHRDAWVMGAADPTSGTISLHEIIRGFGALLRKGWKPLRTIVFASWDAEEYGLIGSTEWGEDFPSWIAEHVVAYLNVDVSVAGSRWTASASPSLAHLFKKAALDIPHPTIPGKTLWDAREDDGPYRGSIDGLSPLPAIDAEYLATYELTEKKKRASDTGILPLGSGSDFTVFLQRLGVASSDEGFAFTPSDAIYHYHSIYDSQRWQEVYGDPGFHRHVAVARHLGLVGLRLIDSIIVPLNTTQYALELDEYLDQVENVLPQSSISKKAVDFAPLRHSIKKLQIASFKLDKEKLKAEAKFRKILASLAPPGYQCKNQNQLWWRVRDWIKGVFGVQPPEGAFWTRYLDIDIHYTDAANEFAGHSIEEIGHRPFPISKLIKAAKRVSRANNKLKAFERGFISEGGIKDREWYKHLGVAPGKWLGYGATTLPALTESLTIDKNVTLAQYEADRLVELFNTLARQTRP